MMNTIIITIMRIRRTTHTNPGRDTLTCALDTMATQHVPHRLIGHVMI